MPLTRHAEQHFTSGEAVRDIVIGMSDGLTVPFATGACVAAACSAGGSASAPPFSRTLKSRANSLAPDSRLQAPGSSSRQFVP